MKSADLSRLPRAAKAYINELETGLAERDARIDELNKRLDALEEQYRLALARQYAPKSELDNLSTHTPAALYQALPPAEARRILQRIEFHYTPRHASWLNMVEIEIGVLRSHGWIAASTTATG